MPVAVEDLLGRPRQVLDSRADARADRGQARAGHRRRRLHRQRAGPPDRRTSRRPGWSCWITPNSCSTRSTARSRALHPQLARRAVLGDIRDRDRLESVFAEERPELVFHAAALKHVPLAEANPPEAVATNVLGTRKLAEACLASGRRPDGADLHRQGGGSDQRHGRDQARGRADLPGARPAQCRRRQRLPLHRRALRQCAGLGRLGRAAVPGAARPTAGR